MIEAAGAPIIKSREHTKSISITVNNVGTDNLNIEEQLFEKKDRKLSLVQLGDHNLKPEFENLITSPLSKLSHQSLMKSPKKEKKKPVVAQKMTTRSRYVNEMAFKGSSKK